MDLVTLKKIALVLLIGLSGWLSGCDSSQYNPTVTDTIIDDRNSTHAVLIFREYRASLYEVKYKGKSFLVNTRGGVVEISR